MVVNSHIDNTIGLVSFPPNTNPTRDPVSLYSLLSQPAGQRTLPTQEQRMRIASTLSLTLYTYLLARWYYKRFISDGIVFLYQTSASNSTSNPTGTTANTLPSLKNPHISSFGLSRPVDPKNISFPLFRSAEFEIYLHPLQLQAIADRVEQPKARPAFEIYGFGLTLAEIGFWNKLSSIAGVKRVTKSGGGEQIRKLVIAKYESDLAFWGRKEVSGCCAAVFEG